jgi:LemA protein
MTVIAAVIAAALIVWGIFAYNLLVRDRARVAAAWSDVDVQLKRRHDLIPKLVEVVQQHAGYERGVLERLVLARSQAQEASGPAGKSRPEAALGRGVHKIMAVAESYPELKASQGFLDLQRGLSQAEDQITVNNLNTRVDTFPDLLVARLLGFRPAEYFELQAPGEAQPAEVR